MRHHGVHDREQKTGTYLFQLRYTFETVLFAHWCPPPLKYCFVFIWLQHGAEMVFDAPIERERIANVIW